MKLRKFQNLNILKKISREFLIWIPVSEFFGGNLLDYYYYLSTMAIQFWNYNKYQCKKIWLLHLPDFFILYFLAFDYFCLNNFGPNYKKFNITQQLADTLFFLLFPLFDSFCCFCVILVWKTEVCSNQSRGSLVIDGVLLVFGLMFAVFLVRWCMWRGDK